MPAILKQQAVGPWPMNSYVILCDETQSCAIVDPGADASAILAMTGGATVVKILLTHAHGDHVGALAEVKAATGAPVFLHPAEHAKFGVAFDVPMADGDIIAIGNQRVRAVHTPGHTPGMISLVIDHRVVVGDTLFVGGPGRTGSPQDFAVTMHMLESVVFAWPDATEFYPGHGPSGRIGHERPAFEAFVARGWPADLCGDVSWA